MQPTQDSAIPKLDTYRCHKAVRAARILSIDRCTDQDRHLLMLEGQPELSFMPPTEWSQSRLKVKGKDLGYLVIYEDGYMGWSPAAVFEAGYTKIEPS